MDKINKQEELRSAIENLIEDTMMLLKTVEVKRDEVSEGVTAQIQELSSIIQELSSIIKSLEKENVSLQSLPKKVAVTVQELIPGIADQLHTLNQTVIENQNKVFNDAATRFQELQESSFRQQNTAINDAAFRLNKIKEEIENIDSQRAKRYLLGLGVIVLISVFSSLGATYTMIRTFPQRIRIQSPSTVTVKDSEVSLWSTQNVSISGDVKSKGIGR